MPPLYPEPRVSMLRRGFTLIELLAVFAIVAVLALLIVPLANGGRAQARRSICQSQLRTLITACNLYVADHGTYPGYGWYCTYDPSSKQAWDQHIMHYIKPSFSGGTPWIFMCPDVSLASTKNGGDFEITDAYGAISYGYNDGLYYSDPTRTPRTPAAISSPARLLVFADHYAPRIYASNGSKGLGDYMIPRHGFRASGNRNDIDGRGVIAAFADGHIAAIRYENGQWGDGGAAIMLNPDR